METSPSNHPLIDSLLKLADDKDRGALASLRRGLGKPPGTVAETFPFVVRFLRDQDSQQTEEACYLVASLFAFHPENTTFGNLGDHFSKTKDLKNPDANVAIERRFTVLLNAHIDDMHFHLRQAISFLKSKEQPIHWNQLLKDLRDWDHPERRVQKRWARRFWAYESQQTDETT